MRTILAALAAYMRMSLATMLQYRGEIVLWAIWGVVYPAVAMAMWSAAVRGSPGGASIGGMAPRDFAAYFLLTMIVGHVAVAWDIFEMGYFVRTGLMSSRLLKPMLPVWQSLSDNLAYKTLTLAILVPIWLIVAWVVQPRFTTTPLELVLGLAAMLLGSAVHFIWNYNLALTAFWITRMDAMAETWWGMNLLFGGRIAPLTIMPLPLQWAAAALPFQWIIWFPSAALSGQLQVSTIVTGLVWQLGWLAAGLIFFRVAWRLAIRHYAAVGG